MHFTLRELISSVPVDGWIVIACMWAIVLSGITIVVRKRGVAPSPWTSVGSWILWISVPLVAIWPLLAALVFMLGTAVVVTTLLRPAKSDPHDAQ